MGLFKTNHRSLAGKPLLKQNNGHVTLKEKRKKKVTNER